MSLGTLFILGCAAILWKDRKDLGNYVIVAFAAIFFAGTRWGSGIGPWMISAAASIDNWIRGLFGVIDVMPLLHALL